MDNLVNQGVELALFGMGTVFLFLSLLIFATKAMSMLVMRYEPATATSSVDAVAQSASAPDSELLVALISAAIRQHRTNKQ